MARATKEQVRLISPTELDDAALDALLDDAHTWVEMNLTDQCEQQSEASLTAVEKYLAAHYAQQQEPLVTREKIGPLETSFAIPSEGSANYAQLAASFDPCGIVLDSFVNTQGPQIKFRVGAGFDHDASS